MFPKTNYVKMYMFFCGYFMHKNTISLRHKNTFYELCFFLIAVLMLHNFASYMYLYLFSVLTFWFIRMRNIQAQALEAPSINMLELNTKPYKHIQVTDGSHCFWLIKKLILDPT